MTPDQDDMQERLRNLIPQPPFFARLRDPRSVLTDAERAARPYLQSNKLVVVVQVRADHSLEMPGVWYRVVDSRSAFTVLNSGPQGLLGHNFTKPRPDIWLNERWCITYPNAGAIIGAFPIYYPVN